MLGREKALVSKPVRRPPEASRANAKLLLCSLSIAAILGGWGAIAYSEGVSPGGEITLVAAEAVLPNRVPLPTVLPAPAGVAVAPGLGVRVPLPPLNLPPIPELPPPPEIQDADTTEEPATGTTADSDASAQQPATIKPIVPQPTAVVAVPRTPPRESAQTPPSAAPAPKPSAPVAPAAAPKPAPSVPKPASEPVLPRVPPVPPAPPVLPAAPPPTPAPKPAPTPQPAGRSRSSRR